MNIEELKSKLNSLPDLHERLQTWRVLINQLHEQEKSGLESCISELERNDNSIKDYESCKELCISSRDYYKNLFGMLIERLNIPIKAYEEKIKEMECIDFLPRLKAFKIKTEEDCTTKALDLAKKYHREYKLSWNKSEIQYIRECESLVTPFLFTTTMFACETQHKRDMYAEEFKGWNPNKYVLIFCKELRKLFGK